MSKNNKKYKSNIPKGAKEREISPYKRKRGSVWLRKAECLYRGKIVGFRYYEKDGTFSIEEPIKNGKRHGNCYTWHENGEISSIEPFYNGKPHGIAKQFDQDGSLLGTYNLKQGDGFDIWRHKDEESKKVYIAEIHTLKGGLPHGFEWWLNFDQKSVWHERHWYQGKLHGIERMWNTNGKFCRGYPQYYINDKKVTKRAYVNASREDLTLPKFREKDQYARRAFPEKIKKLITRQYS